MSYVRKIQHRDAHEAKVTFVDFGGAIDIHRDALGVEEPFGMGQVAGGDRSLAHHVVVGALLLDNFSGEGEGIGGGQDIAGLAQAQSNGSDHAIEYAGFGANVVSAMAGLDVLVVGTAVENDVALEFSVPGVGVVGDLIGVEDVGAVVNLDRAAQVIDGPIFLLLHGADGDLFFGFGGGLGRGLSGGRQWRRGRLLGNGDCGGRGQGLAGYYPRSEKQMTDPGGRDNDSRAGDH
jgi:hypothetical protein